MCYHMHMKTGSGSERPGAAERAAARRRSSDWYSAKFGSFEEMAQADLEEAVRMPPEERLRLVFVLSGQLEESGMKSRAAWPVGIMRFGTESE